MLKTALRAHQARALDHWRNRRGPGFALFMEQRTGKTLTALAILNELKPARFLVVCPKKAVKEWHDQMAEHLDVDWELETQIMTFGKLQTRRKKMQRWIAKGFMVCDESHKIKSPSSKWSMGTRTASRKSAERLALTGTPLAQGIHDAWAQFDFINPEIFGKWSDFKKRYCITGGFKGKKVVGHKPHRLEEFQEIFHRHSYRVLLRDLGAYRVRHRFHKFDLGPEKFYYDQFEEDLITYVNGVTISTTVIGVKSMKLQQATGGFMIDENQVTHRLGNSKLEVFRELIRNFPHAVIAYRYQEDRRRLEKEARRQGRTVQTIAGDGNTYDRENPADWILLQMQSGLAIDLSSARAIIFYSWDFSFLNYEQLKSRILFFGVDRADYHYLIARDTIDEIILEAVRRKKRLADLICDHWRDT